MFNINKDNIITINAGDYFTFDFVIIRNDDDRDHGYVMTNDDEILFAIVEPNQPFELGVVRKIFDKNKQYYDEEEGCYKISISLNSSDTINVLPGRYYYEIKLREDDKNYITTVQSRKVFNIL